MIYGPAFYKLLGIPETVTEPTAYELLGLTPEVATADAIDAALKQRKLALRRNIPGPQFIPVVSMIERQLQQAADTLRDASQRGEYDRQLTHQARQQQALRDASRRTLVHACRRAVRSMVDGDGCLPDDRRDALAERLRQVGLPDDQVQYVLKEIPRPVPAPAETTPAQQAEAQDEAAGFFATAIELEIDRGQLGLEGERKLMLLAEKIGIARELARRQIDHRLTTLGARRAYGDESTALEQFKRHLLAMHPDGQATAAERQRLLALAAADGVSPRQAERVIHDYLAPLAPPPPPRSSLEAMVAPLGLGGGAAPQPKAGSAVRRLLPKILVMWLLGGGLIVVLVVLNPFEGLMPGGAGMRPGGGRASQAGPVHAGLLATAFDCLDSPEQVRGLFNEAAAGDLHESLAAAARMLTSAGPSREQALAEGVFKALTACPPADARVQDAAVRALIAHVRGRDGESAGRNIRRAARMLSAILLLKPDPRFDAATAEGMAGFAERCESAWKDSLAASPDDPLHDARRLAGALTDGGDLRFHAGRTDADRAARTAIELAGIAADARQPDAPKALNVLLQAAGLFGDDAEAFRAAAKIGLCRLIRRTADAQVADKARNRLAAVLKLPSRDPLRTADLQRPDDRARVAAALEAALTTGSPRLPATREASMDPPPEPVGGGDEPAPQPPARPAVEPVRTPLAGNVRESYCQSGRPQAVLADVTATMMACCERIGEFASRPHADAIHWSLAAAIRQPDPAARADVLTRNVELTATAGHESPGDSALAAKAMQRLKADLGLLDRGICYQAIERLRLLDTPGSATALLEHVRLLSRTTSPDLPMVNRMLRALLTMSEAKIPSALAELIEPSGSNYVAHRIVQTLLGGTGGVSSAMLKTYQLPINHNSKQRKDCAARWKIKAVSSSWGSRRPARGPGATVALTNLPIKPLVRTPFDRAPARPTKADADSPGDADDESSQKLLGAFVHYVRLGGELLRTHRAAGGAAAGSLPPARGKIDGPATGEELARAVDLLAGELTRLARQHADSDRHAVTIDMIELRAKARALACDTALQKAAVRLEAAGETLKILVAENDPQGLKQSAVAAVCAERTAAVEVAQDVLRELRAVCYTNLVLLELLPKDGP